MPMKKKTTKKSAPAPARKQRKAPAKRRAVAPRRRAVASNAIVSTIQGRAGQVSFTKSSHKHYASADVKLAKQIGAPSLISKSLYTSLGVLSGSQNAVSFANFSYQDAQQLLDSVTAGTFVAGQGPQRAVVKGCVEEYIMTNATNASCEVDIYDIVCKRDIPNPTISFNCNSYIYGASPFPEFYWATGMNAQQNIDPTPGGLPNPQPFQMLTVKPTDSHLFNDYFRITKKCRVMLPAGGSHKHNLTIGINKYLDQFMSVSQISGLKGFTTYTMFVVAGFPVQAVTDPSVLITSSSVNVNFVRSQRVKYVWVADTSFTSKCSTTLPYSIAPTNQLLINPVNGTADNIVTK